MALKDATSPRRCRSSALPWSLARPQAATAARSGGNAEVRSTTAAAGRISRRVLVGAAAGAAWLATPGLRLAFGAKGKNTPALLILFLRGGCDGLSLVAPRAGADRQIYEAERPNLAIPAGKDGLLPLDERFGMHPAAAPLHALYAKKRLAIVHAAGNPSPSRSHFDAQAMIELGTPGRRAGTSGWLARWLAATGAGAAGRGDRACAVGAMAPTVLMGAGAALSLTGGLNLGPAHGQAELQRLALRQLYGGDDWLGVYGRAALDGLERLSGIELNGKAGGAFPKGEIGNRLASVVQLLKAPLGINVVEVDMGGFDTHKGQGNGAGGHLADLFGQLAGALAALFDALGPEEPLTVVVQTEFGRRVKENANHGTDHGHGGVMLVLGERVSGGRILGPWPGLATEQLYDRADVAVATDYRQVLWEVLNGVGPAAAPEAVFPGFKPARPLGIMA